MFTRMFGRSNKHHKNAETPEDGKEDDFVVVPPPGESSSSRFYVKGEPKGDAKAVFVRYSFWLNWEFYGAFQ